MFACKITGKQALPVPQYGAQEHLTLALLAQAREATEHTGCAWIDLALRAATRALMRWGSAGRGAAKEAMDQCPGLGNTRSVSLDDALISIIAYFCARQEVTEQLPASPVRTRKRAREQERLWE